MFHQPADTVLEHAQRPVETGLLTLGAMVAFAANSILCRLALLERLIDPALFTAVRVCSGAFVLAIICAARGQRVPASPRKAALPGFLLFLYALPFTFAYTRLPVGTGALILFGTVQTTLMLGALRSGHRPSFVEWAGLATAFGGLVYLTAPGVEAPDPLSAALMAVAGVSWGVYTFTGQRSGSPLADTRGNFVMAAIPSLAAGAITFPHNGLHAEGIWLAVASGALASALGYAVWFRALRGLTMVRAAVVQLSVPVLVAAGGVLFLSETTTTRFVVASAAILGGIGTTIFGHRFRTGTMYRMMTDHKE